MNGSLQKVQLNFVYIANQFLSKEMRISVCFVIIYPKGYYYDI